MIYDNKKVLDYLLNNDGKLIHLYGQADAGRTSVLFSLISYLVANEQTCAYLVPQKNVLQIELFQRYVKDLSLCPMCIIQDKEELIHTIGQLSGTIQYIFIDNFLYYVLYRTKKKNQLLLSSFSSYAYKTKTNFVFCNDMRHVPGINKTVPAYLELFRRYSTNNILVRKDENKNIYYDFEEWQ